MCWSLSTMNLHHINWHKRGEGSEALEELLCEKEYNDKDESDSIDNLGCQDLSKEPKDEVIVNAIDVDCFVLPVKVSEFLRILSTWQIFKDIFLPPGSFCCPSSTRDNLCSRFWIQSTNKHDYWRPEEEYSQMSSCSWHHSNPTQCKMSLLTTSAGLHVLARDIMGGRLQYVYLGAYGMRIPLYEVRYLHCIQKSSNPTLSLFDIGINADTVYID